jgi:hypothetical protein
MTMKPSRRSLLTLALLLASAPFLRAQAPVNPAGHWEGTVDLQGNQLQFGVDFIQDTAGQFTGTIEIPSQQLKGLPLLKVAVDGKTVNFYARRDQTLTGNISGDGKEMTGAFAVEGAAMPFMLKRTGDAHVEPPVKSAPVGKELEGTWTATLQGLHVELRVANGPDGATARLVNLDQGGLEIPGTLTQKGSGISFETTIVVGSFAGVLNGDATRIDGEWKQGPASVPLTLTRAGK